MKRSLGILSLLGLLLFSWGCRKDVALTSANGQVQLTVRAVWNGAPFDKDSIYVNALEQRVKVSQLKFFLSDLQLGGNKPVQLFDADLFDVTNGPLTRTYSMAAGDHDSISFGLGLPYALNHAEPVLYPVTHPLGAGSGMLWNWTETFHRFVIFDGRFDTSADSTDLPPYQFSVHTGRDECFRSRHLAHELHIPSENTVQLALDVDIADFFTNENGTIHFDLSQGSQSHGAVTELPQALLLSDMMIAAIHVH